MLMGAVGGPKWDALPVDRRPEKGLLRMRKELGLFANLRPAAVLPALVGASTLRPRGGRGDRPAGGARADGRALLRRAARHGAGLGPARGAQHDGVRRGRDRAHRARGLRRRAPPAQAGDARPQGERAGGLPALGAGGGGGGARLPRRAARAPAGRLDGDAAAARAAPLRRGRHRESVRRHPLRRGRHGDGLARDAAVREPRRRRDRPLRARARLGARHRGPGPRQPAGRDPLGGHAARALAGRPRRRALGARRGGRGRSPSATARRISPSSAAPAPPIGCRRMGDLVLERIEAA